MLLGSYCFPPMVVIAPETCIPVCASYHASMSGLADHLKEEANNVKPPAICHPKQPQPPGMRM